MAGLATLRAAFLLSLHAHCVRALGCSLGEAGNEERQMIWVSFLLVAFLIHLWLIKKNIRMATRCMESWLRWHDRVFLRYRKIAIVCIVWSTLWLAALPLLALHLLHLL